MISNCGRDENRTFRGGKAGDQTGTEWRLCDWYSYPWDCVIRHDNPAVRRLIGNYAIAAANNNHIGYDQGERTTFWRCLAASGYNPANIKTNCEADCSSGVAAIVKAVGYTLGLPALKALDYTMTTFWEKDALKKAGFKILTGSKYTSSEANLLYGDILLNVQHHTCIEVTKGIMQDSNVATPATVRLGGIDVSYWQAAVDWAKVKAAGVQFAIIRAGYREVKDIRFDRNYEGATAAGIPAGAYWYSYATTVEGVKAEAQACIKALQGTKLAYPVYFDIEEQSQFKKGQAFCSSIAQAFCNALEAAGYYAGIYISAGNINLLSEAVRKRYTMWVADWTGECDYTGAHDVWQYSNNGRVNGIGSAVDLDYCYKDFSQVIPVLGFNGYAKGDTFAQDTPVTQINTPKTDLDAIAKQVIRGEWGNGAERIDRLEAAGYDAQQVQHRVNELLGVG